MHRSFWPALAAAAFLTAATASSFAQSTPVGVWKTIDDKSKKEKSLIRITETGGVLSGKVEKILDPEAKDAKCDACSDDRKNLPVVGLTVIRNVKHNDKDAELWDGGDILDPKTGSVYRVRMKPLEGGGKLEVRGYFGAPMFGRSQTWIRVE